MRTWIKKMLVGLGILIGLLLVASFFLLQKEMPTHITYGMTFSAPYAIELGLDVEETFDALVKDLGVRHFRLAAHWPLIEPKNDSYDFSWLDYELEEIEKVHGTAILGVGRRLPRWPECHIPDWAEDMSWEAQKGEIREYIEAVVTRYKNNPAITYWQIENEPFLEVFAHEYCGDLDKDFLQEEIALVRSLDATRPILVTDSGNLGMWNGAYASGDAFGTSVYVYFWNPDLGQFKTVLPPAAYRVKENLMNLFHGKKEAMLIELSLEPWLVEPIAEVPLETQFSRMDTAKFDEIVSYAKETRFEKQYLWGAEWWYWLKLQGNTEMWEKGKQLFDEI